MEALDLRSRAIVKLFIFGFLGGLMLINLTSHIMLSFGETQRTLKSWHDMLGPSGKREVKNGPMHIGLTVLSNKLDQLAEKYVNVSMSTKIGVDQLDKDLARNILKYHMLPPSTMPYNISTKDNNPSVGQAQIMELLFEEEAGGFFVEAGAFDGQTRSNTLRLEREFGWQGVLMEGDFTSLAALLQTQRKAWIVPNCISPKPHTILAKFANRGITGRIAEKDPPDHVIKTQRPGESNVICLPLFSVLQALNRSRVDYFSLDVEGDELEVLKTIPFDLIDIKALSVEFDFVEGPDENRGKEMLKSFMESKGYDVRAEVTHTQRAANDFIFVKKKFKPDLKFENVIDGKLII